MAHRTSHWPRKGASPAAAGFRLGFRSGLEDTNAKVIERAGQPVLFETLRIPYAIPTKLHHYTPDFPLQNGIIVETKGRFMGADRAKHLFVKMQYPLLDIRFVFSNSRAKADGTKMTCAEWCERNGFLWADKVIPQAWLQEQGPGVSIAEALAQGPAGFLDLVASAKRPTKRK